MPGTWVARFRAFSFLQASPRPTSILPHASPGAAANATTPALITIADAMMAFFISAPWFARLKAASNIE